MNAALELLGISSQNRRYAFTYVDSIGVIERHRFVDGSQEAARWAHLVQRNGLEPGGCVLVLAGRDRHWRSALLGVVEAGGIAMPATRTASSTCPDIYRKLNVTNRTEATRWA